jgi:AcrR family transcriptional regulator
MTAPQRRPGVKAKTRRDQNSEATRHEIMRAARRLFARRGYAATPLGAIVRAAKVTTGAVYHHFGDKKALFRAVAEAVEVGILERILAASRERGDPWDRLVTGTSAMLSICAEAHIQRIVFVDAPNVIGAQEWREIEKRFAFGVLRQVLQGLMDAGVIRTGSVDVLAPILLGATIEAATAVARAADQAAALAEAQATMVRFLAALRR